MPLVLALSLGPSPRIACALVGIYLALAGGALTDPLVPAMDRMGQAGVWLVAGVMIVVALAFFLARDRLRWALGEGEEGGAGRTGAATPGG